jgi:hypothetical protein
MVGTVFLRSGGGDAGGGEGGESAAGGRGSIETLGIGSGGLSIAMMMMSVIPKRLQSREQTKG